MYYPCSENKGADQLRGHREADLRFCFRLSTLLVFSCIGSYRNYVFDNFTSVESANELSHVRENQQFAYAKNEVTAKLIIVFVFATRIVQFFYFRNPKFQQIFFLILRANKDSIKTIRTFTDTSRQTQLQISIQLLCIQISLNYHWPIIDH